MGLVLTASAAHAQGVNGLHLRWNACPNSAGASPSIDLSCSRAPDVFAPLIGTFDLAYPVRSVIAMDGFIDLTFRNGAEVPAFWQFQKGSCNQSGLSLVGGWPAARCDLFTNSRALCGAGGLGCEPYITGFAFGPALGLPPNRARLAFTLYRQFTTPIDLPSLPSASLFAFEFDFYMDNVTDGVGGGCEGCRSGVDIVWTEAIFYSRRPDGSEGVAAFLSKNSPGSQDCSVVANPGAVPTRPETWGRLKSLYR